VESQVSFVAFDSATLAVVLIVALSSFGYCRGVRAEGVTLAGIIGFTMVLTATEVQRQISDLVAQAPFAEVQNGKQRPCSCSSSRLPARHTSPAARWVANLLLRHTSSPAP